MRIDNAGNVGIGTTSPASLLHVDVASDAAAGTISRFLNSALSTDGNLGFIIVGRGNSSQSARIGYRHDTTSGDEGVIIYNSGDSSQTASIYLRQAGNVGIGTTTPAAKLDVNGFMRLAKNGSAPATCDATIDGAIALTSARRMCVCDATSWKEVNSATACTW